MPTCVTCKWFDHDGTSPYGVCRAHPHSGNGWPRVAKADWCGEHEPTPLKPVAEEPIQIKRQYTKRNG
jgi:hypothetical protein